jgi:hypothetical protein
LSDDAFQYQLSVSLPPSEQYAKGDMVNVRGRNAQEFLQNLLNLDEHMAAEAGRVAADIRAQFLVASRMGGRVVERSSNGPQNPPSAPQNAPQQAPAPQGQQGGNGFQSPYGAPQAQQQPYGQQPQGYSQPGGNGYGGGQPASGGPQSAPPDQGNAPSCSHGVKRFIEKPYKSGKPGTWKAWACPAQQGDPTQHELEFIGR